MQEKQAITKNNKITVNFSISKKLLFWVVSIFLIISFIVINRGKEIESLYGDSGYIKDQFNVYYVNESKECSLVERHREGEYRTYRKCKLTKKLHNVFPYIFRREYALKWMNPTSYEVLSGNINNLPYISLVDPFYQADTVYFYKNKKIDGNVYEFKFLPEGSYYDAEDDKCYYKYGECTKKSIELMNPEINISAEEDTGNSDDEKHIGKTKSDFLDYLTYENKVISKKDFDEIMNSDLEGKLISELACEKKLKTKLNLNDFIIYNEYYFSDKINAYFVSCSPVEGPEIQKISVVELEKFQIIDKDGYWASDTKTIFNGGKKTEYHPATFEIIAPGFSLDKRGVYHGNQLIGEKGLDLEIFYVKDIQQNSLKYFIKNSNIRYTPESCGGDGFCLLEKIKYESVEKEINTSNREIVYLYKDGKIISE